MIEYGILTLAAGGTMVVAEPPRVRNPSSPPPWPGTGPPRA